MLASTLWALRSGHVQLPPIVEQGLFSTIQPALTTCLSSTAVSAVVSVLYGSKSTTRNSGAPDVDPRHCTLSVSTCLNSLGFSDFVWVPRHTGGLERCV